MRHFSIAIVLALTACFVDVAAAQPSQSQPVTDVPEEFQFLLRRDFGVEHIQAAWAGLPFDSITVERTRCLGHCPAYRLTLYRGRAETKSAAPEDVLGRAELRVTTSAPQGPYFRRFPEAYGEFAGVVDIWTFARLSWLILDSGFTRLQDRYEGSATGAGSTIVSVAGRVPKTVLDSGGVGPIRLWGIHEAIESAAKTITWTKR